MRGRNAVHRVGPADLVVQPGIGHARRYAALLHRVQGLQQHAPVGQDHLVGGAQVLAGAVLYGAHAFAGPLVVHVDVVFAHAQVGAVVLFFGVETPVVVAARLGHVVGQRHRGQALVAHGGFVHRAVEAGEKGVPVVVRVVHRHMHLRDGHGLRQRDHKGLRKHRVGHTHMGQRVGHFAQRGQAQTVGHGLKRNLGLAKLAHHPRHGPALAAHLARAGAAKLLAVAVFQRTVVEKAVQVRSVRRVNAHFQRLQPVAVPQAFEGKAVAGRGFKAVERGEGRRRAALGAEPSKQGAGFLHQRVTALANAAAQLAARRLAWCLQALAADVKFPAVKRAAQAIALVAAVSQVGAAVRAVAVQQAIAAFGVAKQHQVLPQHAHGFHRAHRHGRVQRGVKLVEQGHRLPVVAQQRAPGCAGAYPGDAFVVFGFHGVSGGGWV